MKNYERRVPEEYYLEIQDGGRLEEITYDSVIYCGNRSPVKKRALVYLPAGYDDKSIEAYKVLYLMHGGGGSEEEFIYGQDRKLSLLHIIDHMIAARELEPLIIVTPSFYYSAEQSTTHDIKEAGTLTKFYRNEFRNELVPLIDSRYRTIADREHRAFGGFSMGGETTWEIMLNCLDLVKHFMPLSGDCWIVEEKGGATFPEKTSELMRKYIADRGYSDLSYNVFAFTGDKDIAFPALDAQIKAMIADGWNTGEDRSIRYGTWAEGTHCYQYIYEYIYNILPDVF